MSDFNQMIKGVLEVCVLSIIAKKENYGYEIINELKNFGLQNVSKGSVYPILLKSETNNWIKGEFRPSDKGPKVKYYEITEEGRNKLKENKFKWEEFKLMIDNLLL